MCSPSHSRPLGNAPSHSCIYSSWKYMQPWWHFETNTAHVNSAQYAPRDAMAQP